MLIMILSDGETWTDIDGCEIREVTHAEVVNAMSESRTPEGNTKATFSEGGVVRVHYGVISVAPELSNRFPNS